MNYTKLISKKRQYKYSVNICLDLYTEERIADFIPNLTTAEIIREYLGGIIRGNADTHSRILYGSYGTGKSHLLTVMSAVLGHINTKSRGFKSFTQLISNYDEELASDIRKFAREEKPYMVVPVYADYDDFGKCITFSLRKELEKNNVSVCFKGYYDEALSLLEKWMEGEESSIKLEEECVKQKIKVKDLQKGLSTYNDSYEKVFNSIYTGMTYGAVFNSTAGNLIDNLNAANEAIKDKFRGIVIIFDEFGRYVEDYGETLKVKAVQDLAEYCDHSDYDDYVILVSHKVLSLYAATMKKSISDEWKKVEGRFKTTSINVKYDQCLSLIGHIIPKTPHWRSFKDKFDKELNNLYNQAWDFKGFLLPPEVEGENPFENGYPLHPITLFALDRLSKKVAQNERTFFTYLAGDEDNSLFSQLTQYNLDEFHFIGLDAIYDYFELNIKAFKTDEAYGVYKKLQYALSKLGLDDEGYQTRILKAIAVVNIISDADSLIADAETLTSVVDGNPKVVKQEINELEKKKIIKYMRQYGYYDFFDGSIFDLEAMIEEKVAGISDEMVINILNERFADFAIYPYRYNEHFHMNRVFIPTFVHKADLLKKSFQNKLPKYYDGAAMFVLDDQADEDEYRQIDGIPERTLLIINGKSRILEAEVKRYIAIQYYYSKKDELAKDDPTVVGELSLYLNEQESIVSELIRKWKALQFKGTFVMFEGAVQKVSTERDLSNVLSNIMEAVYNRTLIVNNDLLNKNVLSGAIKLAREKALEYIMGQEDIYAECSFLSPEFNIIRATLSKNGIISNDMIKNPEYRLRINEFNVFQDGVVSGTPIMEAIYNKLSEAESSKIPMSDLYKLLKREPFGLRDGYIPVLVAYALKRYQNVSLYFHGNEHSYSADELIKALEEPENYTLYICNWNEEETNYIQGLEDLFSNYLSGGDELNRLEELFRAMNAHYASISKSARTTEVYVSDIAKIYRNIMSLSYKDYNSFFFKTLPSINGNLQELVIQISNIKDELESVSEKQYVRALRVVKQVFGIDEDEDLITALHILYIDSWEEKSQRIFDYTTNGVLDLVSKVNSYTERVFVNELAKAVTGFDLNYWTDNKINDFEEILRETVNRLHEYDPTDGLQEGEMKITIESAEGTPIISQFSQSELTSTGQMMLNKIKSTLGNFGRSISYEEKISIMAQLLKEIIN